MCLRDIGDLRWEKEYKKHFLFEKAEEKFMQELDVVRVVKTLRKFKMFAQAMMAQRHRMILRFQRQNLVETSSSSSDSDDNNYDPVRLMENHNPFVRLITYGKVKKMMMQFQNKHIDPLEGNIMRGMFRRKLKDFAELQSEIHGHVSLIDRFKKNAGERKHACADDHHHPFDTERGQSPVSKNRRSRSSSSSSSCIFNNCDFSEISNASLNNVCRDPRLPPGQKR